LHKVHHKSFPHFFIKPVNFMVDFLFPAHCAGCGVMVRAGSAWLAGMQAHSPLKGVFQAIKGRMDGICAPCWQKLRFLGAPCCAECGQVFAVEDHPYAGSVCAPCLARPNAFRPARSALAYDRGSAGLILAFKHADQMSHSRIFARWMLRAGQELLQDKPLLVPVPMAPERLWRRRYNQAALLAIELSRLSNAPLALNLLARRGKGSQAGQGRRARRQQVAGAFYLAQRLSSELCQRPIVLIDDVWTTGATLQSCAKLLQDHGVVEIRALTLARVVEG
jgi:ComF family protein